MWKELSDPCKKGCLYAWLDTYTCVHHRWNEVSDLCAEKREIKIKMEEKGRLLKSQTGTVLDTVGLNKQWDELELRLSAHEKSVEEQKDKLRVLIEKRIKDFKVEIEKFAARWKGSKPDASGLKDRESAAAILEEVCVRVCLCVCVCFGNLC
jgi:hypothetical protein